MSHPGLEYVKETRLTGVSPRALPASIWLHYNYKGTTMLGCSVGTEDHITMDTMQRSTDYGEPNHNE